MIKVRSWENEVDLMGNDYIRTVLAVWHHNKTGAGVTVDDLWNNQTAPFKATPTAASLNTEDIWNTFHYSRPGEGLTISHQLQVKSRILFHLIICSGWNRPSKLIPCPAQKHNYKVNRQRCESSRQGEWIYGGPYCVSIWSHRRVGVTLH